MDVDRIEDLFQVCACMIGIENSRGEFNIFTYKSKSEMTCTIRARNAYPWNI